MPSAHQAEWEYLQSNTDLWHRWEVSDPGDTIALRSQLPEGQVLIACRGHAHCQREYRALTCRSFPFFPYIDRREQFIGMSYHWDYEDRCWVISNLHVITRQFLDEFVETFDSLFEMTPDERDHFAEYSEYMRTEFQRLGRAIPLLHRNGNAYKISPGNERIRRAAIDKMPKFGPYEVAARLPFPDEEGE